jgi:aminoglycoside 3-N-acetyltransferase
MADEGRETHLRTFAEISEAVHASGLDRGIVCLHSSLKSFGRLKEGPDSVIQPFVQAGCTLVVPAFTYECEVITPLGDRIPQNGYCSTLPFRYETAEPFSRSSTFISKEMGAVPARTLAYRERVRGNHPLNSLVALGPFAAEIMASQTTLDVYGPYKRAYRHERAFLVLAGVGLTKATPIHYAEEHAGRRLFRRWARYADGSIWQVAVGSCSKGFENFAPKVRSIEQRIQVLESQWRIYPFRAFVDAVSAAIVENPVISHCGESECTRCGDAVRGGPIL